MVETPKRAASTQTSWILPAAMASRSGTPGTRRLSDLVAPCAAEFAALAAGGGGGSSAAANKRPGPGGSQRSSSSAVVAQNIVRGEGARIADLGKGASASATAVAEIARDLIPQLEANTEALLRVFSVIEELETWLSRVEEVVASSEQHFVAVSRAYDARHPQATSLGRVMRSLSFMAPSKSGSAAPPIPGPAPGHAVPAFSSVAAAFSIGAEDDPGGGAMP